MLPILLSSCPATGYLNTVAQPIDGYRCLDPEKALVSKISASNQYAPFERSVTRFLIQATTRSASARVLYSTFARWLFRSPARGFSNKVTMFSSRYWFRNSAGSGQPMQAYFVSAAAFSGVSLHSLPKMKTKLAPLVSQEWYDFWTLILWILRRRNS